MITFRPSVKNTPRRVRIEHSVAGSRSHGKPSPKENYRPGGWVVLTIVLYLFCFQPMAAAGSDRARRIEAMDARVERLRPDPAYQDDAYGLLVVQQALISIKEGSGGIGACLVDETTGKIVAAGRNRQYIPYFRSDLHAEMDLLTRYEDWLRKKGGRETARDLRDCRHLILVSSAEPCPMCLTRMINAGIKKMVYVIPDETGGMVSRMDQLPPFWKKRAVACDYRQAVCSPAIQKAAHDLFHFSHRTWGLKKQPEVK